MDKTNCSFKVKPDDGKDGHKFGKILDFVVINNEVFGIISEYINGQLHVLKLEDFNVVYSSL
jgi:hypothetical protein